MAAAEVGFKVAIRGNSPAITHRAADNDVMFSRAPIDADGAEDLLRRLRTLRRLATLLSDDQVRLAAAFIAGFRALAASTPWRCLTFEVNPLKIGDTRRNCSAFGSYR